jgi:hypothetical protein
VFSIFRAEVRIIDAEKKSDTRRVLLQSVTDTSPGQKLDEKLALLTIGSDVDCEFGYLVTIRSLYGMLTISSASTKLRRVGMVE